MLGTEKSSKSYTCSDKLQTKEKICNKEFKIRTTKPPLIIACSTKKRIIGH